MGNTELIKDWAFTGGRPARPLALPTDLGTSWAQPMLPQWPSQINLFWVWVLVIAVPLLTLPEPVSPPVHSGASLSLRICLRKKGSWWGKTQVVPAPHIWVVRPQWERSPLGISWV